MNSSFSERVLQGVLISDGAMGTQLHSRGGYNPNHSLDFLNVTNPNLVKAIHLDYISAGAEMITTNTYRANAPMLTSLGVGEQFNKINAAAVKIAQEARSLSGQQVWIAGSIGPPGKQTDLFGASSLSNIANTVQDQADVLANNGVDLILLETFPSVADLTEAVSGIRKVTDLPIVAQLTFMDDKQTPGGDTALDVVAALNESDVIAYGANCSVGPSLLIEILETMISTAKVPLIIQPNAGFGSYQFGRLVYGSSPSYMAEMTSRMLEIGGTIVGGCCGTTPEHTAQIRDIVHFHKPGKKSTSKKAAPKTEMTNRKQKQILEPTALAQSFKKGQFVVTLEVTPPRGFDFTPTLNKLRSVSNSVHAFNVTDSPRAQGRMSALAAASIIQARLGKETILHLALRHRNLLALHGELLGAHALGARNIFTVMGDAPNSGDYPQATAISDVTPSGLIKILNGFNDGVDASGRPMEQATKFLIGCALDLNSNNMETELRNLDRKINAGADFLMSQPVYDPEKVERFRQRLGGFPLPLLLGVLPLRNTRHAHFLDNEVPGITIPDQIINRLEKAEENASEEGYIISQEIIKNVRKSIAGVYFIPAFGQYDSVNSVMNID